MTERWTRVRVIQAFGLVTIEALLCAVEGSYPTCIQAAKLTSLYIVYTSLSSAPQFNILSTFRTLTALSLSEFDISCLCLRKCAWYMPACFCYMLRYDMP